MKIITSVMAASLALVAVLRTESRASALIYDDTQICTIYDSVMNWDMTSSLNQTRTESRGSAPFNATEILDLRTLVFADQSTPEVFGLVRQGNFFPPPGGQYPAGKRGGYSHLDWWNTGSYNLELDRGVNFTGTGTQQSDNFFTTPNSVTGFQYNGSRNFKTATGGKKRASMKIDYKCNTPSVPGYTLWLPFGGWDMSSVKSLIFPTGSTSSMTTSYGLSSARVIDLSAGVLSDPDEYGYVQVDNLEHLGSNYQNYRGRGGMLWIGGGCRYFSPNALGGGQSDCGQNSSSGSSFHKVRVWAGSSVAPNPLHRTSAYSSTTNPENRGWLKIQYTGPKITAKKVPYAMKTRAIASGNWDMTTDYYKDLSLWDLRVNARRIANISTTIISDTDPYWNDYTTASNFHRPIGGSGATDLGGGYTYVDEANGIIRLQMVGARDYSGGFYNFYTSHRYYNTDYQRAWVSIDYLAGSCAQGPNDLEVDFIPSGPKRTGNCEGSSQPFLLKGAGDGFGNTLTGGATEDAFTFFSKRVANDGTKVVHVRVNSVDYNNGLAGITLRDGKGKDRSHATLVVDAYGTVSFLTRNGTGNANVVQGTYSPGSFPIWLRLEQTGSSVYAYALSSSVTTPPSYYSYTGIGDGADVSGILSPEEFDVGMVVSNDDWNYDLTSAWMAYFDQL